MVLSQNYEVLFPCFPKYFSCIPSFAKNVIFVATFRNCHLYIIPFQSICIFLFIQFFLVFSCFYGWASNISAWTCSSSKQTLFQNRKYGFVLLFQSQASYHYWAKAYLLLTQTSFQANHQYIGLGWLRWPFSGPVKSWRRCSKKSVQ